MTDLTINTPYLIARSGETAILVDEADLDHLQDLHVITQLWSPRSGYSTPRPLQQALKFLYELETVTPPEPWRKPAETGS